MTFATLASPLRDLTERGVLGPVDVHVAETIGRLGGEGDHDVLLAAALAARAPRYGHVCVEIDRVAERIAVEDPATGPDAVVDVAWPPAGRWLDALSASPATRGPGDDVTTPLVLDGRRLYLDRYWRYQGRLRDRLLELSRRSRGDADADEVRHLIEVLFPTEQGAPFDRQRLAAALVTTRDLTVISGGPGTGKTTTIVRILAVLLGSIEADGPLRIALAAPTGKAAARMQEAIREGVGDLPVDDRIRERLLDLTASTLHRLLGWRGDNSTRFRHDVDEPLPHDVVVVDEASMVSLALMTKLVDAIRPGGRLLLVGDRDQLASVEAGAVLGDICGPLRAARGRTLRLSGEVAGRVAARSGLDLGDEAEAADTPGVWDSIVQLERFYRFGPETGIGGVARAIQRIDDSTDEVVAYLRGEATEDGGRAGYEDVELIAPEGDTVPADVEEAIVAGYRPVVEAARRGDDPVQVIAAFEHQRVLAALRAGPEGVATLNPLIEGWLERAVPGFRPRGPWYLGRPIIVTQNDYGVQLFNGDVGVVVRHPEDPAQRTVAFPRADGGARFVGPARLPPHETVFAMTVHKAQGSQVDRLFLVLPSVDSPVLTRELIYTAITRAKRRATVVAREEVLRRALARPVQRASGLADLLWEAGP